MNDDDMDGYAERDETMTEHKKKLRNEKFLARLRVICRSNPIHPHLTTARLSHWNFIYVEFAAHLWN